MDSTVAATLEVGPKQFCGSKRRTQRARAGDVVLVYPRAGERPYVKTAVFVRQKNLTFRGVAGIARSYIADQRIRVRL